MIIVSQDKKRIINFNNITDINIEFVHSDYELRASFVGEVGTKKNPGWFYGFKADIWQAYAVGVTYLDMQKRGEI